jgi:HPt (histidine-containing phosphotransfer) domain-containing protein
MPYEVEIDADLADLIPGFLENRKKELVELKTLLQAKNFAALRAIGHKMKGTAGGYGFMRISELGKEIEIGADAGQDALIQKAIESLEDFLKGVVVKYVNNG